MGRSGDRRALKPLLDALNDDEPPARLSAAKAVGRLGFPEAAAALSQAAREDGEQSVRMAALEALGRIGDEDAAVLALEWLSSTSVGERLVAVEAVRNVRGDVARTVLRSGLADSNRFVAYKAARHLAASGDPEAERSITEAARTSSLLRRRRLLAMARRKR